jgi:hypothetical protein
MQSKNSRDKLFTEQRENIETMEKSNKHRNTKRKRSVYIPEKEDCKI